MTVSDFGAGKWVIGTKEHRCEWCGQSIHKGEKHYQYKGVWDGEWQNWRMHEECHDDYDRNYDPDGFSPFSNERPTREVRA